MAMDKEIRDQILQEDFGFLDTINVQEIDGKLMLGDGATPFNVESVIYEKQFVKEWLIQFAVGNSIGINLFDLERWYDLSKNGAKSVMVVDENHKPVIVVPPLLSNNLSQKEMEVLRLSSAMMYANSQNQQVKNNPQANLKLANELVDAIKDVKRRTYEDLITPEFFEKYNIVPLVEQQFYFIQKRIVGGPLKPEDDQLLRSGLYKNHKEENLSPEEIEVINRLSKGTFELKKPVEKEKTPEEKKKEKPENPFDC